jgi:hypothetical protein
MLIPPPRLSGIGFNGTLKYQKAAVPASAGFNTSKYNYY